jgi:hypothetical protein
MIINNIIKLKIHSKNIIFLKEKYNDIKVGDIIEGEVSDLTKGSSQKVKVACFYCNKELTVPYKRYLKNTSVVDRYSCNNKECSNQKIKDVCQEKYGVDNPFQAEFVKEKGKETLKEKWGVEHQMYVDEVKNKIKETCLEKYGVDSYTKTEEYLEKTKKTNLEKYGVVHESKTIEGQLKRKITRIKKGKQLPDEQLSDYRKYRLKVNRILQRNKNKILQNWDGYDYYDDEYIKDNFKLDKKHRFYPHFDHKISVIYGFRNNIDHKIIGSINNICITKQYLNCLKREMNENEFKDYLKSLNS